ncbi:NAD-dependent epimerase/dehydratase family protein [Massilia endophytica]|uniref:NAD-dependent epimerase/dehydratase family protein n=1 Tax=Massilia endophytica TaxID=2899220 RepID=UPI001E2FE972|nr:NAD(P)-dependent oxidoreductase [Massilia endophytica]UGQ49148.1 NAD(P)-dependent oxidoreductase [Massilia endophytica]
MSKPFRRILLTGAAGGLGRQLRGPVKDFADVVRLADIADMGEAQEGEEIVQCDLADRDAVLRMCEGVDAVLHFGGISTETPFAPIMNANILGMVNLYEAVHKHGIRRVVFASSNHTMGMYRTTDMVDATMPLRPDGYYGVSKVFGESLSRFYWDRFGIETVCIRIGSCFPEPANRRMLSTYISLDDLVELLRCSLTAPRVGHTITFGVSDNPSVWWDDRHARHLGFVPKDNSAKFASMFPAGDYPPVDDLATIYQGGGFLYSGPQYPQE